MSTAAITLFEHLCALRASLDPTRPEHDPDWRAVRAWLEATHPGGAREEDARQETLIAVMRAIGSMKAETPAQAAAWLRTVHRRKRHDAHRADARDPVRVALRSVRDDDRPLERLEAEEPPPPAAEALASAMTKIEERVEAFLEVSVPNPRKRLMKGLQARATLLRVIGEAEADVIAERLAPTESLGKDRIYKWVERGRAVVAAALEGWPMESPPAEREEIERLAGVVLELVNARRADAGRARPERRRDGADPE